MSTIPVAMAEEKRNVSFVVEGIINAMTSVKSALRIMKAETISIKVVDKLN